MMTSSVVRLGRVLGMVLLSASLCFSQENQRRPREPSTTKTPESRVAPASAAPTSDGQVPQPDAKTSKETWEPWTPGRFYEEMQNPKGYKGGRGLISAQGMSGMFLNPTSGTLEQGQLTVQYCILIFQQPSAVRAGHGIMGAYGLTDFLEVGGFANVIDRTKINGRRPSPDALTVAGPFTRFRFLKDEAWWPELSVAGIYLDGDKDDDAAARGEVDLLASKYFQISEKGALRSFRAHLGGRQIIRHENPSSADANATLGFIGADVEFPMGLHAVSEVGTKDGIDAAGAVEHFPWAVGGQWRPNNVVGLSIAAVQTGTMRNHPSLYIGIGVTLGF